MQQILSNGQKGLKISIPCPNVTNVCFGGKELHDMFVITARENLSQSKLKKYPLSGSIFKINLKSFGIKGKKEYLFKDS